MKKLISLTAVFYFVVSTLTAQTAHEFLLEGDKHYNNEQYDLAAESYRKAKEKNSSEKASYNLANSLYAQERYEEAVNQYQSAIASTTDAKVLADAYYNMGNTQVKNQKLKEAIESYKKTLQYDPESEDAISNLLKTKMMLQQQKQQQQQQQQENQDQDSDENQEQQEQEQQQQEGEPQDQDQEQEEQQEQDSQQDQEQEGEEQEQKEQQGEEKTDMDKEDARKLLEIIDNEEKKVQEKLRKTDGKQKRPQKDW